MTTQVTITNDGPYVVKVQRTGEMGRLLAVGQSSVIHLWGSNEITITEPCNGVTTIDKVLEIQKSEELDKLDQ